MRNVTNRVLIYARWRGACGLSMIGPAAAKVKKATVDKHTPPSMDGVCQDSYEVAAGAQAMRRPTRLKGSPLLLATAGTEASPGSEEPTAIDVATATTSQPRAAS